MRQPLYLFGERHQAAGSAAWDEYCIDQEHYVAEEYHTVRLVSVSDAPGGAPVDESSPRYIAAALELGRWAPLALERLIADRTSGRRDPSSNVVFWCDLFLNTPFERELRLAHLPATLSRVHLRSFDTATFAYHVLALASATSLDDYIRRLHTIRHKNGQVGTLADPQHGNFLDSPCEALLFNCIDRGILRDITTEIAHSDALRHVSMKLLAVEHAGHRPMQRPVQLKYPGRPIDTHVLRATALTDLLPGVNSGDLIVFTQGPQTQCWERRPAFVSHLAFAAPISHGTGFIHSTNADHLMSDQDSQVMRGAAPPSARANEMLPGVVYGCDYPGGDIQRASGLGDDWNSRSTVARHAKRRRMDIKVLRLCQ